MATKKKPKSKKRSASRKRKAASPTVRAYKAAKRKLIKEYFG